jgi:putative inorganic carbon (hco3(-)) transporter
MLRTIFVLIITLFGAINSLRSTFYALLFYLWIAYFRPETWIWSNSFISNSLSLYAGIFLLISFFFRGERLRINGRTLLLGIILTHSLTSTLISDHFQYCWPYWKDFAKVILITYLMVLLTTSVDRLKLVILIMALSLSFEGAKQGWGTLILHPGSINNNQVAFLGDNNCVAVGMLMLAPLLLTLAQGRRWIGTGFRFLAIGVVYRALSTYSRGGLLSFIAMCGLYWRRTQHKLRNLLVIGLLAGLILSAFPETFWQRMRTITISQNEMDESMAGRIYFWGVGAKMAFKHPFFGVGHNGYQVSYNQFDSVKSYGLNRSVHSMWFGILAESGFVGLLLFLLIIALSLRSCVRVRKICGDDESRAFLKSCATAIETALITAAVGGTFLPFQYVEMLWHFFGLSIAVEQIATAPVTIQESYSSIPEPVLAPAPS